MKSVKIILRDYSVIGSNNLIDYDIRTVDNELGRDWVHALQTDILQNSKHLEKNYCFHGFPHSKRNLYYLCGELNIHIHNINRFNRTDIWQGAGLKPYIIEEHFYPEAVRFPHNYPIGTVNTAENFPDLSKSLGLRVKHGIMNRLHNHFECLQGTVEKPSKYFATATHAIKHAIRQLNNLCHEIETLCLSERKLEIEPFWVRPSQITTFFKATRFNLNDKHRKGFLENSYNREFGGVYMHWCQLGKTLFEVWRDEDAPVLTDSTCKAITHLQYYSGEFDIEWGNTVTKDTKIFHAEDMDQFTKWLKQNNLNPHNPKLSLGYLKIGQINLKKSFGTTNAQEIWKILGNYLDIYKIECGKYSCTYDYHWSSPKYIEKQIEELR